MSGLRCGLGRYCRPTGQVPLLACSRRTATDFCVLARLVSMYAILLRRLLNPVSVLENLGTGCDGWMSSVGLARFRPTNVIRTLLPERIVKQYQSYCKESGFEGLGRSTLLRILKTCAASMRKSLQGLDYISCLGAEAFDDLLEVIEVLGDADEGMGWMKRQQHQLRESKSYLKSDYKVCSTSHRSTMEKLRELSIIIAELLETCTHCL